MLAPLEIKGSARNSFLWPTLLAALSLNVLFLYLHVLGSFCLLFPIKMVD